MKRLAILFVMIGIVATAAETNRYWWEHPAMLKEQKTVKGRLQQYGATARGRLMPYFTQAGLSYPPSRLIFVGIKNRNILEVYGANRDNRLVWIHTYPILRASGTLGPKLKEGDRQVPEGLYKIELLNPNSSYHLSLRIGYPNAFDREQARKEGRTNLGGDIMIHGGALSVGCLAMGDEAAEDLFILAAETGIENIDVVLTPVDFRKEELPRGAVVPEWIAPVYKQIRTRLAELKAPN
jgi:hypothetical protein